MNYFKSFYDSGIAYSPNWYGTLSYAPAATVLLYDDNQGFCIGCMESELPEGVQAITEQEALSIVASAEDVEGVWFGEKLAHRWEEGGIDG
jgi:hypothetical protein